jgi:hypothetical protein
MLIWNSSTKDYNDALEVMALGRISNGDYVFIVNMAEALSYPSDLVEDKKHPNSVGYENMAKVWHDALVNILGFSLTVNTIGNGGVTTIPIQSYYPYGTHVSLTANADSGWIFSGWSGDLSGSLNPAIVTMDSNKTITATFAQDYYELTIQTNFGTTIPAVGAHLYPSGTNVSISASSPPTTNSERYSWVGWLGSGSGSYSGENNEIIVTMNGPITQSALWNAEYKLSIATNLGSTQPSAGDHWYQAGSSVTVEALPPPTSSGVQYVFLGWSGTGSVPQSGSPSAATIIINDPSSITGTWKPQYYLTVTSVYGSVSGSGWYDEGSTAYATISPTTLSENGVQYAFSGWSGDASGSISPSNPINMNTPKTAIANWSPIASNTPTPTAKPTPTASPTAQPTYTATPNPTASSSPNKTIEPSVTSLNPTPQGNDLFNSYIIYGIFSLAVISVSGAVFIMIKSKKSN